VTAEVPGLRARHFVVYGGNTNADRAATVLRCRVNSASGTSAVARVAAALRNAG
jgi:hypothetical protein